MGRCQSLLVVVNIFVVICNIASLNEATSKDDPWGDMPFDNKAFVISNPDGENSHSVVLSRQNSHLLPPVVMGGDDDKSETAKPNLNRKEYVVLTSDGSFLRAVGDDDETGWYCDMIILGNERETKSHFAYPTITEEEIKITGVEKWGNQEKKPIMAFNAWKSMFDKSYYIIFKGMNVKYTVTDEMIKSWRQGKSNKEAPIIVRPGVYWTYCPSEKVFETKSEQLTTMGYNLKFTFKYRTGVPKQLKSVGLWRNRIEKMFKALKQNAVFTSQEYRTFKGTADFIYMEGVITKVQNKFS